MQQYNDVDLEKMKKYIEELELENAKLKHKLEAAQAQIKEWNTYVNHDPSIDESLRRCHDVFLCPDESDYQNILQFLADSQSKLTMNVKVFGRKIT